MKKIISIFLMILFVSNFNGVTYAIMPGYVQSIEINSDEIITMYVGDEITLEATAEPQGFSYVYMVWSSDNENVVKINGDDGTTQFDPPTSMATIVALTEGTAVITVYADLEPNPYKEEWTEHDYITINVIPENTSSSGGSMSVSGISFRVSLDGDTSVGTVYAAIYDSKGKLNAVKQYPAADIVPVAFDVDTTGAYVKIMWWNEMFPMCESQIISLQ